MPLGKHQKENRHPIKLKQDIFGLDVCRMKAASQW